MHEGKIACLKSYSDRAWYALQLMREPLFAKIPPEDISEIIDASASRGIKAAERWLEPCDDAESWLRRRGIDLRYLSAEQKPPLIIFAAVRTGPRQVDVYLPAIDCVRRELGMAEAETKMLKQLVLAHECFHLLDDEGAQGRYSYTLNYKIGPFVRTAVLRQTAEISAAAFAKAVCRLDFNPGLLDAALLAAYDRKGKNSTDDFLNGLEAAKQFL